jgi:hypothetical protein
MAFSAPQILVPCAERSQTFVERETAWRHWGSNDLLGFKKAAYSLGFSRAISLYLVKPFIGVSKLSGAKQERKFNMNEPDIKQHLDGPFSVLATVLASPGAQGARPIDAIGTYYRCRSILDGSTVRNVTVLTSSVTIALTGMLSGTLVATEVEVFYPNGNLLVSINGTFSGTVAGQSGLRKLAAQEARLQGDNRTSVLDWVIGQGTLGLAGLRGHGSFQQPIFGPATEQCSDDMVTGDYSARLS